MDGDTLAACGVSPSEGYFKVTMEDDMATVWMRSKLQKMKPKTDRKYDIRTLAEHGPGKFRLHNPGDGPRNATVTGFNPDMVRRCEAVEVEAHVQVRHMSWHGPIRACAVYCTDTAPRLIKRRA